MATQSFDYDDDEEEEVVGPSLIRQRNGQMSGQMVIATCRATRR